MIAVVDYCKGNLKSVERGLISVGADARITDSPAQIAQADAIVLPGVGAFADASATLIETGQMDAIREAIDKGVPFLGICLGLHLLLNEGEEHAEGPTNPKGLGILDGTVVRMPAQSAQGKSFKVPHVGWNSIEFDEGANLALLDGISSGEYFYYTHSYIVPVAPYTCATTEHSQRFSSVVKASDLVWGVQFHPEKSSDVGARILENFLDITRNS